MAEKLCCNRCMHEWVKRKKGPVKFCPNCKSPYWNKVRVREMKKEAMA